MRHPRDRRAARHPERQVRRSPEARRSDTLPHPFCRRYASAAACHHQRRQRGKLCGGEIFSPRTAPQRSPSGARRLFAESTSDLGHRDCRTRYGNLQSAPVRRRAGREVSCGECCLGSCGHPRGQLGRGEPRASGDRGLRCLPGKNRQRSGHETSDRKFHAESAAWEAAGIHVDNWAWESHERAETAVYDAFPEKIGIEPGMKLKSCADNNHMGKRMFDKHLAVGETDQSNAAKAAEMALAEAGVRLAMILNEAAKPAN